MPVIISGTYEDLNRGFIEGLREALKERGLNDIVPKHIIQRHMSVSGSGRKTTKIHIGLCGKIKGK